MDIYDKSRDTIAAACKSVCGLVAVDLDHVTRIEDRSDTTFAGLESRHDVLVKLGFAVLRCLNNGQPQFSM